MAQVVKLHGKNNANTRRKREVKKNSLIRSRLIGDLDNHTETPMVLLYAPAGYGKTVLLQQYQDHLKQAGVPVCWLTLDANDQDAEHLAKRIAKGLPELASEILSSDIPASSDVECALILDNAERIVGSDGENLLLRLLEQQQENLHLYVASRVLPNMGTTRLQLSGDLLILNSQKLSFNQEELTDFFEAQNLAVPANAIQDLHRQTEGWPVALQIACVAMQKDELDLESLVKNDAFSWRQFHRYVQDEVLKKLSGEQKDFLLEVAPLGRITVDFAESLSGVKEAATHITFFEEKGLLALEDSAVLHQWYRIHPLLSGFLENLLKKENPKRLKEVHRAAIEWNKEAGRLSDAVRHAFAAGDTLVAAELLERASWERRRHGKPTPVGDWSDHLSEEAYEKHPLLRTEAACSFAASFAVEAARVHANSARKNFSDLEPLVRDDLFAVDALIKIYADQPEGLVEVSERGLRDCTVRDPYTLGSLHLAATIGYIVRGKFERAKRAALEAKIENDRAENAFGTSVSHMLNGLIHAVEGNLTSAVNAWKLADNVIQPATKVGLVDKIAIGYLPEALYEWNLVDEAQLYLDRCLDGPVEIMVPDMLASTYLTAARMALLSKDVEKAFSILDDGERIAVEKCWPRFSHAIDWERVRFHLLEKNLDAAKKLRNKITKKNEFIESTGILTHALEMEADLIGEFRYESLMSPNPAIISRLRAATTNALSAGRKWRAIKLLVIEALCRKVLGDQSAALRALRTALKYGASSKMIRTFLDEGPIIITLIQQIRSEDVSGPVDIPRDYLDEILSAAGDVLPDLEEEVVVVEALSDRELEVLKLVFDGCSNAEAARRLFVSENTIKWHLQHIYSKLGVKNRTAAVAAARALNLIV